MLRQGYWSGGELRAAVADLRKNDPDLFAELKAKADRTIAEGALVPGLDPAAPKLNKVLMEGAAPGEDFTFESIILTSGRPVLSIRRDRVDAGPSYLLRAARNAKVMPLLSPDNYAEATLCFVKSARQQLLIQNQSFKPGKADNDPKFAAILDAVLEKQRANLDVRIIFRKIGDVPTSWSASRTMGSTWSRFAYRQTATPRASSSMARRYSSAVTTGPRQASRTTVTRA